MAKKNGSFPKTLGACVDLAYRLRAERQEEQAEAEARIKVMKEQESALEEHILASFDKSDIEGARGTIATASVTTTIIPTVKDWPEFYKYILKHKAFDLLEKRPARLAYRERLDAGEAVPGVEPFHKKSLSLTKISK